MTPDGMKLPRDETQRKKPGSSTGLLSGRRSDGSKTNTIESNLGLPIETPLPKSLTFTLMLSFVTYEHSSRSHEVLDFGPHFASDPLS
jgi:hypothetical protein